jgi:hypothetical protein
MVTIAWPKYCGLTDDRKFFENGRVLRSAF